MSLFLDFPCSLPGKTKVTAVAWCAVEPICAIVTDDHCISFYLEEGVSLEDCRIQRKADATILAWHPKAKALASGWEDGCVAVWGLTTPPGSSGTGRAAPTTACIFAADSKHGRTPVRIAMWNPSATRLVTGDGSGAVIIWKVLESLHETETNSPKHHRLIPVRMFLFSKSFRLDQESPARRDFCERKPSVAPCRVIPLESALSRVREKLQTHCRKWCFQSVKSQAFAPMNIGSASSSVCRAFEFKAPS